MISPTPLSLGVARVPAILGQAHSLNRSLASERGNLRAGAMFAADITSSP